MTEGGVRVTSNIEKQPKVTIITVVFNAAQLLDGFFSNITPYLGADVELVIIDGQSTDGTLDILRQHSHLIDYWRSEPDNGIYDAMNKAVKFARGKWLYFMGADDVLLGGFGKMLISLKDAVTIYIGKVVIWGEVRGRSLSKYDLTKVDICHQSVFYPASIFSHYLYDLHYKVYADQHLNFKCFADNRYKRQFVDELIAIYDTRGFSSGLRDLAWERDYKSIVLKYLGLITYLRYNFRKYKQNCKQV